MMQLHHLSYPKTEKTPLLGMSGADDAETKGPHQPAKIRFGVKANLHILEQAGTANPFEELHERPNLVYVIEFVCRSARM